MRRFLKIVAWLAGSLLLLVLILIFYVRAVATVEEPRVDAASLVSQSVRQVSPERSQIDKSWIRKSESGLYELYVEGSPLERGLKAGMLTKDLVQYQEEVFNKQIHQLVPSDTYLGILKYFVGWFNRDLDESVPEEFRQE